MLRDPLGRRRWGGGGEAGGGPASLSASQLERKVRDIVQETIQNYRSDPEKSAAEESWDYVQFQVRGAPARAEEQPPSGSARGLGGTLPRSSTPTQLQAPK